MTQQSTPSNAHKSHPILSNSIKVSTDTATMSKKEDDATRSILSSLA